MLQLLGPCLWQTSLSVCEQQHNSIWSIALTHQDLVHSESRGNLDFLAMDDSRHLCIVYMVGKDTDGVLFDLICKKI